jgi:hypothetical protein
MDCFIHPPHSANGGLRPQVRLRRIPPSQKMPPRPTGCDRLDIGSTDSITRSEIVRKCSLSHQATNLPHLTFLEPGFHRRLTKSPRAVPEHIVAIGFISIPAQILQAIISCIAIPVTADESWRSRTKECLENELVNISSDLVSIAVQVDDEMAPGTADRRQGAPGVGHLPTTPTSPARLNFTFPVNSVSWELVDQSE